MNSSTADESVPIEKLSINEEEARVLPVKTSTFQIRGVGDREQNLTVHLVVSKFSNLTQITLTSVGKPGKKSLDLDLRIPHVPLTRPHKTPIIV